MHYLVDGYNVTKRDPATKGLAIDEQRDAFERRLRATAARVLGSSSYTIIWDAAGGEGVVRPASDKVAYTRLPTADDAIVERVRCASERIGVITSDHELAERCRAVALYGVDVFPSDYLFAGSSLPGKTRGEGGRKKPMPRDVGIPSNANEINRELKKLWGIED